jgi:acyl-CoA synthetase (AMP-forming)/AMP-acid ligase II
MSDLSPSSSNVARHLRAAASATPDACAVRYRSGGRSYDVGFARLDRDSDACAAWLESLGVRPGMRVLLMVKPGLDLILCTFALFKLGAPPVAIDPGMGLKSFLKCVETTEPDALVGIPLAHAVATVFPGRFKSAKIRAIVGTSGFRKKIRHAAETLPPAGRPVYPEKPDELAAILFTSGSTGAPKGVRYEHGMFEAQIRLVREAYGITPGEIDLTLLPIFALFNPALGMTTVVPDMNPAKPATVDPSKVVADINQSGVTNSFGSPVLWSKIARYCIKEGITLPSIRRILCAGAPVPASLHRDLKKILPNGVVHTPYGATECLPVCTITGDEVLADTWKETESGHGTCVGRPLSGVRVAIIPVRDGAIANLADCPPYPETGLVGEIIVQSPSCTREYDKRPDATALSKTRDGETFWHRMGDLGRLDEQGRLWFYGRKVERVTTPAGDMFTDPVEGVFNTHPRVFRSALIGLGSPGNQAPAVVIEPEADAFPKNSRERAAFIAELRELAGRNPHTAAITRFFFEKKFPVDVRHNAKIHRLTLKKKYDQS